MNKACQIHFHFVREQIRNGFLQVQLLLSKDQIANILTKPLVSTRFHTLQTKLKVLLLLLYLRGEDKDNAAHHHDNDKAHHSDKDKGKL